MAPKTPTPQQRPFRWSATMAKKAHNDSYAAFLAILKWAVIASAGILLFLLVVVY